MAHGDGGARDDVTVDAFADPALKLRALLDPGATPRTLILGPHFASPPGHFLRAFPGAVVMRSLDSLDSLGSLGGAAREPVDVVLLDLCQEWSDRSASVLATIGSWNLSATGALVIALRDRRAPDAWLGRARGHGRRGVAASLGAVRRACRKAGLDSVEAFLALPDHDATEEFAAAGAPVALPSFAPALHRALAARGALHHLHPDFLLVAARGPGPLHRFASRATAAAVAGRADGDLGAATAAPRVDRFALRERGALIVLVDDGRDGLVARGGVTEPVARRLARNATFLDRLHALERLPASARALVPRNLGTFTSGGCEFLVERRMPGTLAWKLSRDGDAWRRARTESLAFLDALEAATAQDTRVDEALFQTLVGDDLAALDAALTRAEARDHAARVAASLRAAMQGRDVRVVVGHGDYGFGNLLCDPGSGALRGVIDWDTHVERELAGVDRMNLLLQLEATVPDRDLASAFDAVVARSAAAPLDRLAATVAAVRMIRRSTHYPAELARLEPAYAALLARVAAAGR